MKTDSDANRDDEIKVTYWVTLVLGEAGKTAATFGGKVTYWVTLVLRTAG